MPAGQHAGVVFSGFPAMKFRHMSAALAVTLLATVLHAEETRLLNNLPKMVYGMLRRQGDRLMFAPCHERSTAIVEDVSVDGSVISILNSVGLAAGKRLYVELLGVFDNGTLKASAVNMARVEGAARCRVARRSHGVRRVMIRQALVAGGEFVQLRRYGNPEVVLPYKEFRTEGKVTRYDGANESYKLSVRLDRLLCRDADMKGVFAWTATLDLNGQVLKGCAWTR
jgi:putative lipoprotein